MKSMLKIPGCIALSVWAANIYCQPLQHVDTLNLDFETVVNGIPARWASTENVSIDSSQSYSGKYSVVLEGDSTHNHRVVTTTIFNGYGGKTISFSGYIKTENVSDGYGCLWMRIDPHGAFDNMGDCGIRGTTDWTKYEITLPFDAEKTTRMVMGGGLTGKGKMWLDNVSIQIDGKDIRTLSPLSLQIRPAERDTVEFAAGSRIANIELNPFRIKNLRDLGMIWGFLKYHHPMITEGNYNWDYELFRILPKIIDVKSKAERDDIFIRWIEGLGEIGTVNPRNTDTLSALQWIKTAGFSPKLTALLRKIQDAPRNENGYYVIPTAVGNPAFQHEHPYDSMKYPDVGYRLLSLYRYWNMIQYFYPYKDIIGESWEEVLKKYIPEIIEAENEEAYLFTMLELAARIHDSHGVIWTANGRIWNRYYGRRQAVPKVDFIQNKAVVTAFYNDSLSRDSELRIGDVITKINGASVKSIVKSRSAITEGSNHPTVLRNIARQILRCNEDTIRVTFVRNRRPMETDLKTYSPQEAYYYFKSIPQLDTCFKMLTPTIGYLYTELYKNTYSSVLWEAVKDTEGLIIDLRCNSSNGIQYGLGNYMAPEPIEFVKILVGSTLNPGKFTFTPPLKFGITNENPYKGKVVILVNEQTQSSLEFSAMALSRIPGAVTIGSTTAGADGNVSYIDLPGGIKTMISGIGIFYPDGGQTQRPGVRIDEIAEPTVEAIKTGKDEVLERAIEIINKK